MFYFNNFISIKNDDLNEENIGEPTLFNTIYGKPNKEINILDICSGNLNHINLKHVVSTLIFTLLFAFKIYILRRH
jgi:hypothetical protein